MILRAALVLPVLAATLSGQVKAKLYGEPETCVKTYRLAPGRVLTSRGLIEDPTVNTIMSGAVSAQMKQLKISEAGKAADVEIRFMGGNGAGLRVDDLSVGDVAMWNIGGPQSVSGGTYKKSNLLIAVVENSSNRTLWAVRCTDKFGDPNRLQQRIEKAVAKAFSKFPKKLTCTT
jgi:Domain of unknown function (DUF4136)